jgi:hypothetical protein
MSATLFKGIGIGLLLASATLLFTLPADKVVVDVPTNEPGVFAVEAALSGWRLPSVIIQADKHARVHHSVERILLSNGSLGVRVLIMNSEPRPSVNWI